MRQILNFLGSEPEIEVPIIMMHRFLQIGKSAIMVSTPLARTSNPAASLKVFGSLRRGFQSVP